MKPLIFKANTVSGLVPPDSVFVLTESSEHLFSAHGFIPREVEPYTARHRTDDSAEMAYWHALGMENNPAPRLRSFCVRLRMLAGLRAADLRDCLRGAGIATGPRPALELVATDDYLDPNLARLNRASLEAGRPWMLVRPMGQTVWVGPLFRPGVTACWECLAAALRENRPVETQLARLAPLPPVWRAALGSTVDLAYSLAVTELVKWVAAGSNHGIEGRILAFDTITHQVSTHAVPRRPDCRACGAAEPRPARLRLMSRPKQAGHRVCTAESTLARVADLVSPVTGIVPALARVSHPYEAGLEIFGARYNLPLACLERQTAIVGQPEGSSGKGASVAAAQVSAIAEAVERYSGIWRGTEPRVRARMSRFGAAAIPPAVLLGFSERQVRARAEWNRRCREIERIPEPFEERAEIEWAPVWSLTRRRVRYVPAAFCYFSYPEPAPYCQADSNGCAAGNTLEEAIVQGYYELAERDAACLWWYPRTRRPAVDLDSFAIPSVFSAREALGGNGRTLHVLDITADLGVTAFAAITAWSRGRHIAIGLAAHLDPAAALASAVSDALWQEAVVGLESANVHPSTRRWLETASLGRHPHLEPHGKLRRASSYRSMAGNDVLADLRTCVRLAAARGIEVLALDQTRGETGLAVARVIAPGLRHLWPRFGPGRLEGEETAMNPVPFPF